MPSVLFYVKADQPGWESSYCISQVLEPIFKVRRALGEAWADLGVHCARSEAGYFELKETPSKSREWVRTATYWSGARRFRWRTAASLEDVKKLEPERAVDMGLPVAIADFVSWGIPAGDEGLTILILWGHGSAWRVTLPPKTLTQKISVPLKWLAGILRKLTKRGLEAEEATRLAIQPKAFPGVPDLAKGLRAGLGGDGRKLGVLAFNSCFMACVELAYEIRDQAHFLVASEEETPFVGWDHELWLTRLNGAAGADPEAVARLMVDSYAAASRPATTLSAIRLAEVAGLVDSIRLFVMATKGRDVACWQGLARARSGMSEYGRYLGTMDVLMVDIELLFRRIVAECEPLATEARAVIERCQRVNAYQYAHPSRQGNYGSRGISVFFPATRSEYARLAYAERYNANNNTTPSFVKDSGWREFLESYWKHVS